MSKTKLEDSRPLFVDSKEAELQEMKTTARQIKKTRRRIRFRNTVLYVLETIIKIFITAVITLIVSLFVSAVVAAINNNIGLDEAIGVIINKIKEGIINNVAL